MVDTFSKGNAFLGAGIAFPLGVDSNGHIAANSLEEHIRQSILVILQTAKGERVMRPAFGAGLQNLVFEPVTPATTGLVQHEVEDALKRFETRIEVLHVDVKPSPKEQGALLITIEYRVRQTDNIFNLVYPFYLERGEL